MNTKSNQVITSCNHSFDVLKKMRSLMEKISLCDINIKIGETTIAAHKVVLASCSPYFEFMFTGKVKENGETDVELKDLCPKTVSALIDYVYSGCLIVNNETVIKILETADFLQITSAKEECLKFLQKNITALNCIAIKYLAKKRFFTELENKVNNFIRWNFLEVIQTETFLKFTLNDLKDFLSDSSFCLISSNCKRAVSLWIQYDKTVRGELEDDLSATIGGIAESLHQDNQDLYDPYRQKRIFLFNESSDNRNAAFFDLKNSALYSVPRRPHMNNFSCVLVKDSIFLLDTFEGMYCQYGIENEKWTKTEMKSTVEFYNQACNVHDRIFLVADGDSKTAYSFDVERNVLTAEPKLIYKRTYPGIAVNGNCIYVCGGNSSPTTAERLDVRTKTWRSIAQIPSTGGRCAAASLGDDIYCAGVDNQFLYKYDLRNGKWTHHSSAPNSGNGRKTSITAADGCLYAVNALGIYHYDPNPTAGWTILSCPTFTNNPMHQPICLYFTPE